MKALRMVLKRDAQLPSIIVHQPYNKLSAIDTIKIVMGIPVTLFDIADDPSVFTTAQVKVLPNAGGLTMSTFSYVAEALLVTVCTM